MHKEGGIADRERIERLERVVAELEARGASLETARGPYPIYPRWPENSSGTWLNNWPAYVVPETTAPENVAKLLEE